MSNPWKYHDLRIVFFDNSRTYNVRENLMSYSSLFIRRVGFTDQGSKMLLIGIFVGIVIKTIEYHI